MLEGILVNIIDASLLRKAMQFYTGVDSYRLSGRAASDLIVPMLPARRLPYLNHERTRHGKMIWVGSRRQGTQDTLAGALWLTGVHGPPATRRSRMRHSL